MRDIEQAFEKYLFENLSLCLRLRQWKEEKRLPLFLRDSYAYYKCELLSNLWLAMVARDEEESTVSEKRRLN